MSWQMTFLTWKLRCFAIYWTGQVQVSRRTKGPFLISLLQRDWSSRPKTSLQNSSLVTRLITFLLSVAWE